MKDVFFIKGHTALRLDLVSNLAGESRRFAYLIKEQKKEDMEVCVLL